MTLGGKAVDRHVRVFVSSTFRDLHAERDHLVTVVFPELRERLERLGLEFFDVDLRWGVPEKGADGEKANSWAYCKQWIDRVEPFFVSLLGQRYGYVPKPHEIRDNADRKKYSMLSITEMEICHAVLTGKLKRRSFFYFRKAKVPENISDGIRNNFVEDEDKVEKLKELIREGSRLVHEYDCEWTGHGFSKLDEFGTRVLEDLWSGVLRDERYVSKEIWQQALGVDPDKDARYTDESKPVPEDLAEKLVALAKPVPKSPLDAEKQQMEAFAEARLRWFQGRTKELKALTDFINSDDEKAPRLAAVVAVPGQGKSALLAKLWQELAQAEDGRDRSPLRAESSPANETPTEERRARSNAPYLIMHFVGATESSADARSLVKRLLDELDRSGIEWPKEEDPKQDFNSLCNRLANRLGDYTSERRIVLILDAVNQLSDGHELGWLPHKLGPQVRIVISCVDSHTRLGGHPLPSDGRGAGGEGRTPDQRVLRALERWQAQLLRVPLGALMPDDIRIIVKEYLTEYCKELEAPHVTALCRLPQAGNPLYLLVLLDTLRTLGGDDMNRQVPQLIAELPVTHPDTVSLFRWVLQRLEVFGQEAVSLWCLYLSLGRVGMTSRELADLLKLRLGEDAGRTALLIERGLRRYLQRRGEQFDFFHGQLREAVAAQYHARANVTELHKQIADYFHRRADPDKKQCWQLSARLLKELPFHLAKGARETELHELFSQLAYLAARTATGQVYEQIADYHFVGDALPVALSLWRDFLQKHAQRLKRHPTMLVALVNHEGFTEAQSQAAKVVWHRPWLHTSPQKMLPRRERISNCQYIEVSRDMSVSLSRVSAMPLSDGKKSDGLQVEVTGQLSFPQRNVSAIAPQASVAFCLERLGTLRVIDLGVMQRTDVILSISKERPLVIACAPDASVLTIFFESGRAELYRCLCGQNNKPAHLDFVAGFKYHLPECEAPKVAWHQGEFWYQATPNTLARISLQCPNALEETLPMEQTGEVAAIEFVGGKLLVALALRKLGYSVILAPSASLLEEQSAHVTSICACGVRKFAAALTSGYLVVFDLGEKMELIDELRVGMVRGSLGWDGTRLLWLADGGVFNAWIPGDASALHVEDNQEVFPRRLQIIPRQWMLRPDGALLLGTTHSLVTFNVLKGNIDTDDRLEEIFGGSTWRAVLEREKDWWLAEKNERSGEVLLGRGVMGRLYCAPDGKGQFFAASGYGPGLVFDLGSLRQTPLMGCPSGINAAVGESRGGCWFTDRAGGVFFADETGCCRCVAKIGLHDIHGSRLESCGSYLVWSGYSIKDFPESGSESARTFVFFRKSKTSPSRLELLGEQLRHPREGICLAVCSDPATERLVMLWLATVDGCETYTLRVATVNELVRWQYQEIAVTGLGSSNFVQAALSADGQCLGVLNMSGEIACLSMVHGYVLASLAASSPFTKIAAGEAGAEFWLIEADARIFRCVLREGLV